PAGCKGARAAASEARDLSAAAEGVPPATDSEPTSSWTRSGVERLKKALSPNPSGSGGGRGGAGTACDRSRSAKGKEGRHRCNLSIGIPDRGGQKADRRPAREAGQECAKGRGGSTEQAFRPAGRPVIPTAMKTIEELKAVYDLPLPALVFRAAEVH